MLAAQGKYKQAYETLEEAQRILSAAGTPRPDYMLRMATYKLQLQDKEGAVAVAQPLITGEATLRGEPYLLAGLYADLGMTDKAVEIMKKQPKPVTQQELAQQQFACIRILEANGKTKKSIKAYKAALAQHPYHLEMRNRLANLLQQAGKTKEAAALYNFGYKPVTL